MHTRQRHFAAAAIAAAVLVTVTACGQPTGTKAEEPSMDAPKSGQINDKPMDIVEMSDGFSNVGAKCDGPNRVYVIFHNDDKYGSLAVVPNDPRCTGH